MEVKTAQYFYSEKSNPAILESFTDKKQQQQKSERWQFQYLCKKEFIQQQQKKGFGSSGAPPLIAYSHLNTANEYKLLTKWTPEIQVPDSWQ